MHFKTYDSLREKYSILETPENFLVSNYLQLNFKFFNFLQATKKLKALSEFDDDDLDFDDDSNDDDEEVSDFDEDLDPDKIEVPGN